MAARIFASLLVLGSAAFLLSNCSSTDAGTGTPAAGNTGSAGSSAVGGGGSSALGGGGSSALGGGGSSALGGGGSSAVGGAGSAGMASGGTGGIASAGGASAGTAQGGSGGSRAGAGGQASGGGSSGGAGGGSGAFALTSSKLTEGAAFASEFTCASNPNHSPPLAWTPGPSAALSYALVLLDTNNSFNHWVVWDIPPSTSMLIESLPTTANLSMPAGAKQVSGQGMGYLGPCPSGMTHIYKFTLYALDVATLPGVTTSSMSADVATAVQAHDIASATLSGTSNAKKP